MDYGTVSRLWNDRSITRHIKKETEKVLSGNCPGEDFALLRLFSEEEPEGGKRLVIADGFSSDREAVPAVRMAMLRADNQMALSGERTKVMRLAFILGEDCPEEKVRREMLSAVDFSEGQWDLAGGNTAVSGPGEGLTVTAEAMGWYSADPDKMKGQPPRAGDAVIVTGNAGAFGGALLAEKLLEAPEAPFAKDYLQGAARPGSLSLRPAAEILYALGIRHMKDVSFGGVYRALSDLAERYTLGVTVLHEALPVRQDTIEICEYLKKNPYTLTGTGGLLAVCHEEKVQAAGQALRKAEIPFGVAGVLTEEKARKVWSQKSGRERFL